MKKYSYLFLLIVSFLTIQAQNTAIVSERIYVTTNTSTLITGETLLCQLHCLEAIHFATSQISKIAYLELIDSNKKIASRQKLYLTNGIAEGQIFIPTTLESGNYKIIAYTQWMLNESAFNFFETDIKIINPFAALKNNNGNTTISTIENSTEIPTDEKYLKTSKKTYTNREKVNLNILAPAGNYNVSVRKMTDIKTASSENATTFQKTTAKKSTVTFNKMAIPELRGELLSGKISSKSTGNVANKTVSLTIKDKSFATKLVKTDADGKFTFILDKDPISPDIVIQVFDDLRDNYVITLDEPKTADISKLVFSTDLNIAATDKQAIEELSVAAQIENAYYNLKKDSIQAAAAVVPFYHPFEKTYVLNDYTRFPTIRETITEILQEVDYRKNRKGYEVFIKNYGKDINLYGAPLVLIDGFPIQDLNELFEYPALGIQKVDIINNPYLLGPKTFSGVISFTTTNLDFEPKSNADYIKKTTLLRPLPHKIKFNPDYSDTKNNNRIPDYRQQLLWLPYVKGSTEVSFFTSDASGNFEIIFEGFTASGEALYSTSSFEVK